ncbi:MAG: DNA polymerase I [Planctomycetota bacterium]
MPRLFLLDGTALAFRAHYGMARTGLTAPDGTPTGATYGFTTTLRRILEEEAPDFVAVALDTPEPTFRHRRFPAYKATRERAPEEMIAQLDVIREVIRAHGVPIFERPGYEADDVIGTLARQGEAAGCDVFIVTGDKDFLQLVGERIRLYNVFRPGGERVIQGVEAVQEKFGTTPDRVVDVLAIMGDSSDNIPGVKGIGEKGAIKLIAEFGSVEGLLARIDELPAKTRERIERDREMLLLSRELVQIDCNVPLDPGFAAIRPPRPDRVKLTALFLRLDFQSLLQKLAAADVSPEPTAGRDYRCVRTAAELEAMIAALAAAGRFAVDTETTSLFPLEATIVGVSFSAEVGRSWYVPFNLDPPVLPGGPPALLARLAPLLTDPRYERIAQNAKYDWLVFHHAGLELPPPDFDTMVASFCVAGAQRRHNLDALALHYFGIHKIPTKELIGTGQKEIGFDQVPVAKVAEYAGEDADVTWRLHAVLERELAETGATRLFRELEMPLVPVLAAMERRGIRLDVGLVARMSAEMEGEIETLRLAVQEHAGENFNVNSTKVLGEVLFEKLRIQDAAGVKRPRRTATGWATDAETLSAAYGDVPIVKCLLEYRELAKLKSTYVDALPRYVNRATGRIHCSFSQVSAATGRLASSDPNLQNIPARTERGRRLRAAFVPPAPDAAGEWVLLAADYSQIELRVLAHLSGDPELRRVFENGEDVHAATARRIFGVADHQITREMRSQAKVINFGLLYGMGPQRLARETGLSVPAARDFMERYFASFPTVRGWMDRLLAAARETGYVETLFGRRRRIADINSANSRVRALAENAAINTPVQGSAADIIKRAMIDLEARLAASSLSGRTLLQVHDELVLEVPERELAETRELVRQCMEHAVALEVPLRVDFGHGPSWREAH